MYCQMNIFIARSHPLTLSLLRHHFASDELHNLCANVHHSLPPLIGCAFSKKTDTVDWVKNVSTLCGWLSFFPEPPETYTTELYGAHSDVSEHYLNGMTKKSSAGCWWVSSACSSIQQYKLFQLSTLGQRFTKSTDLYLPPFAWRIASRQAHTELLEEVALEGIACRLAYWPLSQRLKAFLAMLGIKMQPLTL